MNIEPLSTDSLKFNTCKFRSKSIMTQIVKRCSCKGGDYEIKGFVCNERKIFNVTEQICQDCEIYQAE